MGVNGDRTGCSVLAMLRGLEEEEEEVVGGEVVVCEEKEEEEEAVWYEEEEEEKSILGEEAGFINCFYSERRK